MQITEQLIVNHEQKVKETSENIQHLTKIIEEFSTKEQQFLKMKQNYE